MFSKRVLFQLFLISLCYDRSGGHDVDLDGSVGEILDEKSETRAGISEQNESIFPTSEEKSSAGNLRGGEAIIDQETNLLAETVPHATASVPEEEADKLMSGFSANEVDTDTKFAESFYDDVVNGLQDACHTECFSDVACDTVCPFCRDGTCQKAPTCGQSCDGTGPGNCDQSGSCTQCVSGICQVDRQTCTRGCNGSNDASCTQNGCSGFSCNFVTSVGYRCTQGQPQPQCNQQCSGVGANSNCDRNGPCPSCLNGRCQADRLPCTRVCAGSNDASCTQNGCSGFSCNFVTSVGYRCTQDQPQPQCNTFCVPNDPSYSCARLGCPNYQCIWQNSIGYKCIRFNDVQVA